MIRRATPKEIRYACEKFHYAHVTPSYKYAYSYFNAGGGWCGAVIYSAGANRNIGKPYGYTLVTRKTNRILLSTESQGTRSSSTAGDGPRA